MKFGGTIPHALDSAFHSGQVADAQVPASFTRDAEWNAIDFVTATAQAALSAEAAIGLGAGMQVRPDAVGKTANQVVNNSITVVDVTELGLSVPASATLQVHWFLNGTSVAGAGWRFALSLPAGAAFALQLRKAGAGAGGIDIVNWVSGEVTLLGTGILEEIEIAGIVRTVNAGTIQLRYAQSVATVGDTGMDANCNALAIRVR